jgi:hypothetical protein
VETALRKGLKFREVVTSQWATDADNLELLAQRANPQHRYRYTKLDADVPPFLNFTIIQDRDGNREVFCGWIITPIKGFEQPCLRFRDPRVVDYFLAWHNELSLRGASPSPSERPELL